MSKEIIKCTDRTIGEIVEKQIKLLGDKSDLNHLDVSEVTNMSDMFKESQFNGDISKWDGLVVFKTIDREINKYYEQRNY